jgi:integrase
MAAMAHLKLVAPGNKKRTAWPVRRPNKEYRTREHLTEAEVDRLIEAASRNLQGHRDATMILMAYRHGLRASEVCDLRWEQIDLNAAILHVRRVKAGTPATHPLTGRELRALRRLQREQEPKSPFVFVSQRRAPFTNRGFQALVDRAGQAARLKLKVHPHMLRHSSSFLASTNREQKPWISVKTVLP